MLSKVLDSRRRVCYSEQVARVSCVMRGKYSVEVLVGGICIEIRSLVFCSILHCLFIDLRDMSILHLSL